MRGSGPGPFFFRACVCAVDENGEIYAGILACVHCFNRGIIVECLYVDGINDW